eukprot:TRINITY_DN14899_c0_g2_i1.p1 TRINITY_DN14899_c0_g2~~TRINITY_DN14899_c0_g2_i1.p1  ORF type:complete len:129 (-),score=14.84 TRINITY_DN14899_c0_g2_i1:238-624(-)
MPNKPFPESWGQPPRVQTRDLRELPGGYGRGSGTLAKWIGENLAREAAEGTQHPEQANTTTAELAEADWGQLVGQDGDSAVEIVAACPGVAQAMCVPEGSMVTMDMREDRVRVFVDAEGKVSDVPRRG